MLLNSFVRAIVAIVVVYLHSIFGSSPNKLDCLKSMTAKSCTSVQKNLENNKSVLLQPDANDDFCYLVVLEKMIYQDADNICKKEGGRIAWIEDLNEAMEMFKQAKRLHVYEEVRREASPLSTESAPSSPTGSAISSPTSNSTSSSFEYRSTNASIQASVSNEFWIGLGFNGTYFYENCPGSSPSYLNLTYNLNTSTTNQSYDGSVCQKDNKTDYCWYNINTQKLLPFICEIKQEKPATSSLGPKPTTTVMITRRPISSTATQRQGTSSHSAQAVADPDADTDESESGLSAGALVAIFLVAAVVIIAAVLLVRFRVKKKNKNEQQNERNLPDPKPMGKPSGSGRDVEASKSKGANVKGGAVKSGNIGKGAVGDAAISGGPGGPEDLSVSANDEDTSVTMKSASEDTVKSLSKGASSIDEASSKEESSSKDESSKQAESSSKDESSKQEESSSKDESSKQEETSNKEESSKQEESSSKEQGSKKSGDGSGEASEGGNSVEDPTGEHVKETDKEPTVNTIEESSGTQVMDSSSQLGLGDTPTQ